MPISKDSLGQLIELTDSLLNHLSQKGWQSTLCHQFKQDKSNWIVLGENVKAIRELEIPVKEEQGETVSQLCDLQNMNLHEETTTGPCDVQRVEKLAERLYYYVAYPEKPVGQTWLPKEYFNEAIKEAAEEIFSFLDTYLRDTRPWMYRTGFDDYQKR